MTEESNEAKLLRMLIGYFHVSLMTQLSLARYGKTQDLLEEQEKTSLSNDLLAGVSAVAQSATPETLQAMLSGNLATKPPNIIH